LANAVSHDSLVIRPSPSYSRYCDAATSIRAAAALLQVLELPARLHDRAVVVQGARPFPEITRLARGDEIEDLVSAAVGERVDVIDV
jgi:hypothetical protein